MAMLAWFCNFVLLKTLLIPLNIPAGVDKSIPGQRASTPAWISFNETQSNIHFALGGVTIHAKCEALARRTKNFYKMDHWRLLSSDYCHINPALSTIKTVK